MKKKKASNSYLMSVMAVMVGLPLPVFNSIASLLFYFGNRRSNYYVKWHCTQALLSQLTVFIMNSVAITWTLKVIFGMPAATDSYFAYIITVIVFNIAELVINISAAIKVSKGRAAYWFLWGPLTDIIIKPVKTAA